MARYKIEYSSTNNYEDPVTDAVFEFNVVACQNDYQFCLQNKKENSLSEPIFSYENKYGFEVNRVRTVKTFKEITFKYQTIVDVTEKPLIFASVLSPKEENDLLLSTDFYIQNHIFIRKTHLTQLFQLPTNCPVFISGMSIYEYLITLNKWVNTTVVYQKKVTTVKTTALEVLKLGKGVCQDFVHLFLAICRTQKIPCRYVSGYLNHGDKYRGTSFMHAWVEAFVPELGWIGLDPTNDLLADYHFIKVCHGADYSECTPIKGILFTNGKQEMEYKVLVSEQ
jgi:transglutaminase-like putative cysteine protease